MDDIELPPLPEPNEPPVFGYTSADLKAYARAAIAADRATREIPSAQPAQEPAAWLLTHEALRYWASFRDKVAAEMARDGLEEGGYTGAVLLPLYAAPAAPAAPSPAQPWQEPAAWDGRLPDTLQKSLNALYLECPEAVVREHSYRVRDAFEAICTSLATTQRMFRALQAKVPVDEGGTAAPAATQPEGQEAEQAAMYRWVRRKMCFTGNGDGTASMHAINLPARAAWPEVGQVIEGVDAAIRDAMRQEAESVQAGDGKP